MNEEQRGESRSERFWEIYLAAHQQPVNRLLHVMGTLAGTGLLIWAIAAQRWWLVPMSFIVGYGFAWVGHFLFERNVPLTLTHPVQSFFSDYRLVWHVATAAFRKRRA